MRQTSQPRQKEGQRGTVQSPAKTNSGGITRVIAADLLKLARVRREIEMLTRCRWGAG